MTNNNPIHLTLSNGALVLVKKVADNKYDFELLMPNGNRKTFIWLANGVTNFSDKKGNTDSLVAEAITQFITVMNI